MTIENVPEASELARTLLITACLVFAWLRFREARAPIRRGRVLYGVDLVLAVVLVAGSGWFDDLVTALAGESVPILIAIGLVAGIAGLATTGLVAAGMLALGGGGQDMVAWFLTPLLIGAALRNTGLQPEMLPRPSPHKRSARKSTKHNGKYSLYPGGVDIFWGVLAKVVGVIPVAVVLLTPESGQSRVRIGGAIFIWITLYCYDMARKPLLMSHRRSARSADTGIFLVLLAVSAGPLGELAARWWRAHSSIEWWQLALLPSFLFIGTQFTSPRFDGRRGRRPLLPALQIFFCAPQLLLVCTSFPFLVGGVFYTNPRLAEISAPVVLYIGLTYGVVAVHNSQISAPRFADVIVLMRASAVDRRQLIAGWICDNFIRSRGLGRAPLLDYSLSRAVGLLAELSAESSTATAGLRIYLPWGGGARLDHTAADQLLDIADEMLEQVDACFPPETYGPGTPSYRAQQTARASLAIRRSEVAYYLNDFEALVAAIKQAADHYAAIGARAHAATVLIHTANRLSILEQHETAADLLAEIPEDLPPVIRRFLLVIRASAAHRAHRNAAARTLLSTARAIPQRTGFEFRKAFLAERVSFPSFAEGALKTMVTAELRLDREFGNAHPTRPGAHS